MSASQLLPIIRKAVMRAIGDDREVAVAYSGGVDSSVIAAVAGEQAEVTCYTCAVSGSYDALNVRRSADEEGLRLKLIEINGRDLAKRVALAAEALQSIEAIPISYTIPLVTVLSESIEGTVLAGNGADELFAGYAKYSSTNDPRERMSVDLGRMLGEAERLRRWSTSKHKRLELPFTDTEVVSVSDGIPLEEKISSSGRKLVLREVARQLGIPSYDRPKKAAQYSSGVLKLMRSAAKEGGESLDEWVSRSIRGSRRSAYESG